MGDFTSPFDFPMNGSESELQRVIRQNTRVLRTETISFIENMAELHERKQLSDPFHPRLPYFYVQGYNVLKKCCSLVFSNYIDPLLDFLPRDVEMCVLSEFQENLEMPEFDENGFLVEKSNLEDTEAEKKTRYQQDIDEYIRNYTIINREFPGFPMSFQLSWTFPNLQNHQEINRMLLEVLETYHMVIWRPKKEKKEKRKHRIERREREEQEEEEEDKENR